LVSWAVHSTMARLREYPDAPMPQTPRRPPPGVASPSAVLSRRQDNEDMEGTDGRGIDGTRSRMAVQRGGSGRRERTAVQLGTGTLGILERALATHCGCSGMRSRTARHSIALSTLFRTARQLGGPGTLAHARCGTPPHLRSDWSFSVLPLLQLSSLLRSRELLQEGG